VIRVTPVSFMLACGLMTADLVAQRKPPRNSEFACPMHPQVRTPENGTCPICGMNLVAVAPRSKKIEIPAGGLRAYCESYIEAALQARRIGIAAASELVSAHVALRNKDCRERLRRLLGVAEYEWLSAVALHLGRLQDRESIPLLEKLLAGDKVRISETYYCQEHVDLTQEVPGKCRRCGKPLSRCCSRQPCAQLGQLDSERSVSAGT